jgi:glycosyltransferase involved in cell wall biosynthesis
MPLVSVVVPARNAAETLAFTLASLAGQTFRDFELILVDDGSTDATVAVAERYADRLVINLIRHETGRGVAEAINSGVLAASGEYIARLDADDLAREDRFAKQVAFMNGNRQIDICGSSMAIFTGSSTLPVSAHLLQHPCDSKRIHTGLVQRNTLAHPSLMIRREFFERVGLYDSRYDYAEDYELWTRGALLGSQYANLDEPLTYYRRHAGQASAQKAELQCERDLVIKKKYLLGWLDGVPPGQCAELLSPIVQFSSREGALRAWADSAVALVTLAAVLPSRDEFAAIMAASVARHLR